MSRRRSPIADLMAWIAVAGISLSLFRDADPAEVCVGFVVMAPLVRWASRRIRSLRGCEGIDRK